MNGDVPRRGEIWLTELDKVRPVIVLHRDFAGRMLGSLLVVPLTTSLRAIPTNVRLSPADGVDRECEATLDNLTLVRKRLLIQRIGVLRPERMADLGRALAIAVACDWAT